MRISWNLLSLWKLSFSVVIFLIQKRLFWSSLQLVSLVHGNTESSTSFLIKFFSPWLQFRFLVKHDKLWLIVTFGKNKSITYIYESNLCPVNTNSNTLNVFLCSLQPFAFFCAYFNNFINFPNWIRSYTCHYSLSKLFKYFVCDILSKASYFNFLDIKLKKFSMVLMSGLSAVILICLTPYNPITFQAALYFLLGSSSTFTKHFWKFVFSKFCKTFPIHAFILIMNRGNKSANWNDKLDLEA